MTPESFAEAVNRSMADVRRAMQETGERLESELRRLAAAAGVDEAASVERIRAGNEQLRETIEALCAEASQAAGQLSDGVNQMVGDFRRLVEENLPGWGGAASDAPTADAAPVADDAPVDGDAPAADDALVAGQAAVAEAPPAKKAAKKSSSKKAASTEASSKKATAKKSSSKKSSKKATKKSSSKKSSKKATKKSSAKKATAKKSSTKKAGKKASSKKAAKKAT